ncbi:MAG TPA: hypothetical protein VFI23_07095 [Rhizomicrobium sp.]|nr:hypothetical protein [Rhizomicrobium sp.]
MRASVIALVLLAIAAPAAARLWKPAPNEIAQDYLTINHNKGEEGRVIVSWMASPAVTTPSMKQLLDKYVVLQIVHTRPVPGGVVTWDEIQGVQVSDGAGQPLKEVISDAIPPALIGMFATSEAAMRQTTQGRGKAQWSVWETGAINACQKGKLVVTYDGETYSFDTPIPGCAKP